MKHAKGKQLVSSEQPSQNAIGRALGLSSAAMSKLKKQGMPVHSVEAASAWRAANIKETAHRLAKHSPPRRSAAVQRVAKLMTVAGAALEANKSIAGQVPALRAAMHAVPERERPAVLLHAGVMDVLVAEMGAVLADGDDGADEAPATGGAPMDDDEAAWMGRFWYGVAAGEIRPT